MDSNLFKTSAKRKKSFLASSEFTNIATAASSIGTLIAAIIAVLALQQVIEQRRATYRPEVVAMNTTCWIDVDNSIDNENWASTRNKDLKSREGMDDCAIPIVNVGLGSAREVSIKWAYQADRIFKEVKSFPPSKHRAPISLELNILRNEKFLDRKSTDQIANRTSYKLYDEGDFEELITSASIEKEPKELLFPHAYKALVGAYLYYYAFDERYTQEQIKAGLPYFETERGKRFLDAVLTCEYFDIEGTKYSATYDIKFDISRTYIMAEAGKGKRSTIKLKITKRPVRQHYFW